MEWTDKMDAALRSGIQKGLSASQIGKALGITRNAVLGRTFRLRTLDPSLLVRPSRRQRQTNVQHIKRERGRPSKIQPTQENIDFIKDMKDAGYTFTEIAEHLNMAIPTVRNFAISHCGYEAKPMQYFSDEDVLKLCKLWKEGVPIEDIADELGRSYGVIRQKALQLMRSGFLKKQDYKRDAYKTRILRKYGEDALKLGSTPKEALHRITEAKRQAFAEAVHTARQAALMRRTKAINDMNANIAAGMDRNHAIFLARAEGATLDEIAVEFNLTRERVRQICLRAAEVIALKRLTGDK